MVVIDMTTQLSALLIGLNVLLVIAGAAVAFSAWFHQNASNPLPGSGIRTETAVVVSSSSAPSAEDEEAPSDSIPEAA
jgi:hypothetical protein